MIPVRNLRRFMNKALRQPGYAVRVFGKRLAAGAFYHLGQGKSPLPEAITLFLTHRCNLHCRMCGQWGDRGVTGKRPTGASGEELSGDELLQFIGEVSRYGPNITLFGGEPLLHPECLRVVRAVTENRMHCLLISNGSLLKGKAQALVESGLDELNVSVDGPEQLHDEIRGMPGLWLRIMEGLKELERIKRERKSSKPLVNLQCTISKFNYRQLRTMPAVAAQAGADSLTFHHLIFLEEEEIIRQQEFDRFLQCSSRQWEGFVFPAGIDPELLIEQMRIIRAGRPAVSFDFYPRLSESQLREYYAEGVRSCPSSCKSPWVVAYVFPNGEVRPCLNFSYSFGSIRERLFPEIWNGPEALRYRRLLKQQGKFPVCKRCTELYRY